MMNSRKNKKQFLSNNLFLFFTLFMGFLGLILLFCHNCFYFSLSDFERLKLTNYQKKIEKPIFYIRFKRSCGIVPTCRNHYGLTGWINSPEVLEHLLNFGKPSPRQVMGTEQKIDGERLAEKGKSPRRKR